MYRETCSVSLPLNIETITLVLCQPWNICQKRVSRGHQRTWYIHPVLRIINMTLVSVHCSYITLISWMFNVCILSHSSMTWWIPRIFTQIAHSGLGEFCFQIWRLRNYDVLKKIGGTCSLFGGLCLYNTPVTLIRNQQESSRTSRNEKFSKFAPHSGGNFKPSHTIEAEWAGMTAEWKFFIYSYIDMRFGGVLNYVRTHSRVNRDVPTKFEPHSSGNRKIQTTFELHSSWILLISK